jgi:uncharacterized protein
MGFRYQGEFRTDRSPEEVYDFLTNPQKFATLLPDFQGMTQGDATHFMVTVKVAIAYMSGNVDMNMELTEAERPVRAQYAGKGSVAGTNVALTAGFDLLPAGTGTKVAWQGEAEMSGGLAAMAGPLLEPAAKKNVMKLIDGLQFALRQKR